MKKPLIVANWKCNPTTLKEARKLFSLEKKGTRNVKRVEVVICPPFVYLPVLRVNGAQDVFWEEKGAFTGEVSPKMLKDLGCKYVIIGHSERRRYFEETDLMINRKIKATLKEKLKPILCIETVSQVKKDLKGIEKKDWANLVLAYEPVWAIGTGKACGIPEARAAYLAIRKIAGWNTPILYGGSVDSGNAKGYIKEAGFQGLLIGGASINAKEFIKIVKNIDKIKKIC